ncbi:MAG: helix-turn-helix domain-containing protein [Planctomycetes bacterium]|nr:helix-turn-helix domain-containing protein [Planctomycetota bacterium]
MPTPAPHPLLPKLGRRVRQHRLALGWTIKQAAERAGLSPRFLTQLESGQANIAIGRLAALAEGFGIDLSNLIQAATLGTASEVVMREGEADAHLRQTLRTRIAACPTNQLQACLGAVESVLQHDTRNGIALIGMRGAGKSTVGPELGSVLALPFIELNTQIEELAGIRTAEIFSLHGEDYYQKLAYDALADLIASGRPVVVALPGGIVRDEATYNLALHRFTTVWLHADAEDHFNRVLEQGDHRPMAGRQNAPAELKQLLRLREPLYSKAEIKVQTSDLDIDEVVYEILDGLG